MYTVYIEDHGHFYNTDKIIDIYENTEYGTGKTSIWICCALITSVGGNPIVLREKKTSIPKIIAAIHNAKENSERKGVPLILDLSDGTPIIKNL